MGIKNVILICLVLIILGTPIALAADINQPPVLLWKFQGDGTQVYGAPAVHNDTVYYSTENTLYAVENGNELWEYNVSPGVRTDLYYTDNKIFFGDLAGNITVINATNAELIWTYHTDRYILGSPRVFDQKVYAPSTDGNLYCINMSGQLLWKFKTDDTIDSTPLIYDGKVLFDSDDLHFYALDASTGNLLWKSKIRGQSGPKAVVDNGRIYTSTYFGAIYCIDPNTGNQLWTYSTNPQEVYGSILADDDRLFDTTPFGTIYSLNALSGAVIWRNNTTYDLHLDMSLMGSKLLILDRTGYLLEVNKNDGTILSRTQVTSSQLLRGQTLTDSGILYFGDKNGTLYAYKIMDFEAPESNTTMFLAIGGIIALVLFSMIILRLKR